MRRRRYRGGAGGYRGRRTLTDLLRIIAIILGVAVVLVLAGLFLAQDYIVYTDDGIRLELPFLADKEEPVKSSPDPNNITVKEETKEEEPVVETAPAIKAVQLPVSTLLEGTAQTLMEQAGANALILEMKGQDGSLAWHSDQNLAEEAGVNGDQAVNDALQKLEEQLMQIGQAVYQQQQQQGGAQNAGPGAQQQGGQQQQAKDGDVVDAEIVDDDK